MGFTLAPIQPSPPPPMYCAQCGVEIDPAAWECANCHCALHVPGAMTSSRPFMPGPKRKSLPAYSFEGKLFAGLLVAGFCVLQEGLRWELFPKDMARPLFLLYLAVLGVLLWAVGFFDRQRP